MRVTLVNPPLDTVLAHGHVSPVTAYLFYNSAPLGILYIAAVLELKPAMLPKLAIVRSLSQLPAATPAEISGAPRRRR